MRRLTSILFAACVWAGAAAAQAPVDTGRYAIDVSVMRAGVEIASGRTVIREEGQAEIVFTGADGQYLFTANLQPEQGDSAEGRLLLEAYLSHDGVDLAEPRLLVARAGRALMQVGSKDEGAATLTDGVEIGLTPLP